MVSWQWSVRRKTAEENGRERNRLRPRWDLRAGNTVNVRGLASTNTGENSTP